MLKPIKLNDYITIKDPVIMAPMAGICDKPYRKLVSSFGKGLIVTEMVASNSQVHLLNSKSQNPKVARLFENYSDEQKPLSVQIFGQTPEFMAKSAQINIENGASIIDINMGCPVKKIVGSGSGSNLMKTPKLAGKIIEAVVKAAGDKVPVTVKTRLGWDFDNLNACEIAKIAQDAGAKMVAIHGRTRSQMYTGISNLEEISKVKQSVSIPVIGNGDIKTEEDAKLMIEKTGVDGVMIGRGIQGKPWFLKSVSHFLQTGEKLPEPSIKEKKELMLKHFQTMIDFYGEDLAVLNFRKHASWYSKGLRDSAEFRKEVNISKRKEKTIELINNIFLD